MESTLISYDNRKLARPELSLIPVPIGTDTWNPIPHIKELDPIPAYKATAKLAGFLKADV